MSFGPIGGGSGGGGLTITRTIVVNFPVMGGRGLIAGDGNGAVARELLAAGPIRIADPDGVGGNPLISSLPALTEVARGTIDAMNDVPQQLTLVPEMVRCEILYVSFRSFTAIPGPELAGGLFAAPPVTAGGIVANQPGAAIVPDTTTYDDWAGGLATKRLSVAAELRRLIGLWWCPRIVDGVAQVSATPLQFDISVWGMPEWLAK